MPQTYPIAALPAIAPAHIRARRVPGAAPRTPLCPAAHGTCTTAPMSHPPRPQVPRGAMAAARVSSHLRPSCRRQGAPGAHAKTTFSAIGLYAGEKREFIIDALRERP
jgi:hypothetical protein